jgi:ubiquitin-conjugating enzyme E2 D/E
MGIRKKFILDSWPITSGFPNYEMGDVILERIFPEKEPYCLASFRIEIKIPAEYPFKAPEARILDKIYHPNILENGTHCCCWLYGNDSHYRPSSSLVDMIISVLRVIDTFQDDHGNTEVYNEYKIHYAKFYQKALQSTLTYGQPR